MDAILECPELYHLFPDRVEQIKADRRSRRVPGLNMLKVRELMAKRENKIKKDMDEANANINPTTKIIRLERELEVSRKELTNLMLKYRTVEDHNKKILIFIQELESRN